MAYAKIQGKKSILYSNVGILPLKLCRLLSKTERVKGKGEIV